MRTNHQPFNLEKSLERINAILNDSNTYHEANDVPKIEDLTFNNGKYVKCVGFFIDLRGSTDLIKTQGRKSKTLARVYRAYISEIVAIVNSFKSCKEVNIVGDCVSAIFAGEKENSKRPVIEALQAATASNGIMSVLNVKFKRKWGRDFKEIKAGIGIALGRALVIKAGFSGSGINDLIYMGDVVNRASKMCGLAYKEFSEPICVTEVVYSSSGSYKFGLGNSITYQDFLKENYHPKHGKVYTGDFMSKDVHDWIRDNK
ncbi:adenylate/guanylate cyclase domain-containing protein [Priestia filamentosa]|uniref:adenylate/guanylate cyclase domain-containing protein n=1 Tax=Priestia filamentosa TaxID=1402861 RepID=UPI00397D6817